MLDLTFIRQNLSLVRQKMQERGASVALDDLNSSIPSAEADC
jgi:hypothetical protein